MKKIKMMLLGLTATLLVMPAVVGMNVSQADAAALTGNDLGIQYANSTNLGNRDIRDTVASIINVALGLLGIVAVVIILIGGFTWMTAGGNEEKVTQAKKWIFSGIIGLAIILSAYALASWVITSLLEATKS